MARPLPSFIPIAALLLTVAAQAQSVTVTDGYVSRNARAGAKAFIWAQPNTATRVFAGWTGDVAYLLDAQAPHTTLTVPNESVTFRATYRTVPSWTSRSATLAGIPVSYFVPQDPVGLVFLFHGTGGSGAALFTSSEFLSFARDLVAAGFGVAAFDCLNRTTGQWDTSTAGSDNPDVVRLNNVIAAMRSQAIISNNLPILAFGHSNGGQFAHFSALVMNWSAVSISSVQGALPAATGYSGPAYWWMPKNDDHPQVGKAGGIQTSITRWELMANRRLAVRHVVQEAMPLFPERFGRSLYLTLADSLEIYNIFRTRGWLDENDFLRQNPNEFDWRSALPARFNETQRLSVGGQLEGTYMTHEFANYTPHITIDMFLRAVRQRPELRPVSGASFGGAGLAPQSIATLFTNGLAPGLVVASSGPVTNLAGVSAVIRAASGAETPAPWFFVSPGQGSFLVPQGAVNGNATLKITSGDRRIALPVSIQVTAPGIFTANGNGQGAPAAVILRVAPDNTRSTEFPFAAGAAGFQPAPIRFGDDRLFLDLYATGVRGSTDVQVTMAGQTLTPLYAGAQPQFIGLDQVTFELPASLAGRGRVEVSIVAGGVRSNTVELSFPAN